MELKELQSKDIGKVIRFAIRGMHFDLYLKNRLLLHLYGRYFWYSGMNRATHRIAAYEGDTLVGVLLAEIGGEPKRYYSRWSAVYVKIFDLAQRAFFRESAGAYDDINREMLAAYRKTHSPDGELLFLAADPDGKVKGTGTMLLHALADQAKGKEIYLYTDDACTYQFYERRGFDKVGERTIVLDFGENKVPLTCLLYSRVL